MHKLSFTLKQHTPIIHFQHEQQGATLRATELKPKLDKFLIEKFIQEGTDYEEWLIPGQERALNYKVNINAPKSNVPFPFQIPEGYPLFFGNMNQESGDLKSFIFSDDIRIEFKSFKNDLIKIINENISNFFLYNNFGTRQSKGFGSFTISNTNINYSNFDLYFKIELNNISDRLFQRIIDPDRNHKTIVDYTRLFTQIDIFYKNLRSGINRKGRGGITNFYMKPTIFYYSMNRLGQQWDKKSIKERYLARDLRNQNEMHDNPDILDFDSNDSPNLLFKDLFGLSSNEQWLSYRNAVTKSNADIDRFKSPIFIKPIRTDDRNFIVCIKFNRIDPDFLNKTFNINFGNQNGLQLNTPENFHWDDFLEYLKNDLPSLDNRCFSDNEVDRQPEYRILRNIFNQIK
jgi:hypothetical protein